LSPIAPSDATVRLHPLTMVPEDGGVMVGRPDTGSYALFPEAGAELVRQLGTGVPMAAAVGWYERTSESLLDVDDFVATLEELGFLRDGNEDPAPAGPVRWQRLGLMVFSGPAVMSYLAIVVAALVAMRREQWLRPSYRNLFFTSHLSLIPVVLMAIGMVFVAYTLGRTAEAIDDLDHAIRLQDDPSLRANRAVALQDLGEHRRALDDLNIAITELGGEDPGLYYRRGLSHHALHHIGDALADWHLHLAAYSPGETSPYAIEIERLSTDLVALAGTSESAA
jgi:tetratricopeptide (TPR) repeat protein